MQRGEGGRVKQLVGGYYNGSTGKMRRRLMTMAIGAVQRSQGGGGGGEGQPPQQGTFRLPSRRFFIILVIFLFYQSTHSASSSFLITVANAIEFLATCSSSVHL